MRRAFLFARALHSRMNRQDLLKLWNDHHANNTWITATSKAMAGLTPEQAAWKPDPERHSIWQLINHMVFWHTYALDRARGGPVLDQAEIQRRNWPEPDAITDNAWRQAIETYNAMYREVVRAIEDPGFKIDSIPNMLTHAAYHTGQIMQLRAMQGLPPIE